MIGSINFDLAGKYSEKLGAQTIEGTWSRYKTDMAVARLDRDKNIRRRKNKHFISPCYFS